MRTQNKMRQTKGEQLYQELRAGILSGRWLAGESFPSLRVLGEAKGLSRTTVRYAYDQLVSHGFLEAKERSGYTVCARSERREEEERKSGSGRGKRSGQTSETKAVCAVPEQPRHRFLSSAIDEEVFDFEAWQKSVREALRLPSVYSSYGDPAGQLRLREALANYLYRARGLYCSPDQIFIGAGTQPLLDLLLRSGLEPHCWGLRQPVFRQAALTLDAHGQEVVSLAPGEEKAEVNALYVQTQSLGLGYGPLSTEDRRRLLGWLAGSEARLIVEEDYNAELRYRHLPLPPLSKRELPRCYLLSSLSKTLLPSVRLAYLVVPEASVSAFRKAADGYPCTASVLEQNAFALFLLSGGWERQLRRFRKVYAEKSARMEESLREAESRGLLRSWRLLETHFTYWLEIRAVAETLRDRLFREGILPADIAAIPGRPGLVRCKLCFAPVPLREIPAAMESLLRALESISVDEEKSARASGTAPKQAAPASAPLTHP